MQSQSARSDEARESELAGTAWEAWGRAHAPYSRFSVGAALASAEGPIVPGCNVENVSLGLGICAERVALFSCLARGLTPGPAMVIVTDTPECTPPCGACRQAFRELAPQTKVISLSRSGRRRCWMPADMLPCLPRASVRHDWEPREIIAKKRDGRELSRLEIERLVGGLLTGQVERHQMSAFMMAVFLRGMTRRETEDLTRAMAASGRRLDLSGLPGPKIDKHSSGGVGDKVSLPLVPLALAAGIRVPMISGRGLGHTGGTLDKLDAIPGYRSSLAPERLRELIAAPGAFVAGQTSELAPADRIMYALRDVSATVASVPLIVGSILSKKLSAGLDGLVLDVKFGRGAFMPDRATALELARTLVEVSAALGLPAVALLTRMDEPIGFTVGNALEVQESLAFLTGGDRAADLEELTLALGGLMAALGGLAPTMAAGAEMMRAQLAGGGGREACRRWIGAQGGDPRVIDDPGLLNVASRARTVEAATAGFVAAVDPLAAGHICTRLGGGRRRTGESIDPAVGIRFHRKSGDPVAPGDPLYTLYLPEGASDEPLPEEAGLVTILPDRPSLPRRIDALVADGRAHEDPWDVEVKRSVRDGA
ncbi:MAG: thymidine phosphorylase [Candidatus Eisenbacteria bacterium]